VQGGKKVGMVMGGGVMGDSPPAPLGLSF